MFISFLHPQDKKNYKSQLLILKLFNYYINKIKMIKKIQSLINQSINESLKVFELF